MRKIVIPKAGDVDVFQLVESDDPVPGPEEVRIAVEAAGVNFADLMARMGLYQDAPPFPLVVGYEVAGTVDAVGPGVEADWVGKPVVAMVQFGGYSTHVVCRKDQVVVRPETMDAVTGAALPVTSLTAWMMLEVMARVRPGDRVLVHSAGGGVGLAALDLLKWRGAYAIGTASPGKHALLKERGYDELIDYRSQDFAEVLADAEGLDVILDPIGGESWTKGLNLLRPGGQMVVFGFSAQSTGRTGRFFERLGAVLKIPWLKFNPVYLMNQNVGVLGVNMGRMWDDGARVTGWLGQILQLWEEGVLRPLIHATVPFDEAGEAHRMLHDRENIGKVVLVQSP